MIVLCPDDPVYSSYIPKPLLITSLKNKRIVFRQNSRPVIIPKLFTVTRPPGWSSHSESTPGDDEVYTCVTPLPSVSSLLLSMPFVTSP